MEFSERKRLSGEFDAWRRVQGEHVGILPSTPVNVITFLQIKGYLRESPINNAKDEDCPDCEGGVLAEGSMMERSCPKCRGTGKLSYK